MSNPLDLYSSGGDWTDYGGDPNWEQKTRLDRNEEKEPGPRLRPHRPSRRGTTRGVW